MSWEEGKGVGEARLVARWSFAPSFLSEEPSRLTTTMFVDATHAGREFSERQEVGSPATLRERGDVGELARTLPRGATKPPSVTAVSVGRSLLGRDLASDAKGKRWSGQLFRPL